MSENSYFRLQLVVFGLVSASFTNIYLTQPVLPVLEAEFSAYLVLVSLTVSAVVLGIGILILLIPAVFAIIFGLLVVCTGFFTVHSGAARGAPTLYMC